MLRGDVEREIYNVDRSSGVSPIFTSTSVVNVFAQVKVRDGNLRHE